MEIIEIIESTARDIFKLEIELKRTLKPYKYTPAINFKGYTECFTTLGED